MLMSKIDDPKDQANFCLELLKVHTSHFDKTRQIQWNFNSIFWTGILISTSFMYKEKLKSDDPNLFYFLAVIFCSYLAAIILIQISLVSDKGKCNKLQLQIENLLALSITKVESASDKFQWLRLHHRSILWVLVQSGITFFLLSTLRMLST